MRLLGIETEYGVVGTTPTSTGERRLGPDEVGRVLFAPIVAEHGATNVFLRNGGRLYLDVGAHPEYATAECATYADLLAQDLAGDRIVSALAERAAVDGVRLRLFKNNVDSYGNTYGSHENRLVSRDLDLATLAAALSGFLVARQLMCGAGRVVVDRERRVTRYVLSQRADVLWEALSNSTTRSRPLVNTRDEPHADADRFRRLHVIAGDSTMLPRATLLKIASLDLVCGLAETGGMAQLERWIPADTGEAIRAVSRDTTGRTRFPLAAGGTACALDVLTALHDAVAAALARGDVGADEPLASGAVDQWGRVVAAIAGGAPDDLAGEVDWVAKQGLIEAFRHRHGIAENDPRVQALDVAYHELGGPIPKALARAGRIPPVVGEESVREATSEPPRTRARLRAELLVAAQRHRRAYLADWGMFTVTDLDLGSIDLPDPWATSDERVAALVDRMASEPRSGVRRGFAAEMPLV